MRAFALCQHENFDARVGVVRLTSGEGGHVTGYSAEIRVQCRACGLPFEFIGPDYGSRHDRPTISMDGCELRAPLKPSETGEANAPLSVESAAKERP